MERRWVSYELSSAYVLKIRSNYVFFFHECALSCISAMLSKLYFLEYFLGRGGSPNGDLTNLTLSPDTPNDERLRCLLEYYSGGVLKRCYDTLTTCLPCLSRQQVCFLLCYLPPKLEITISEVVSCFIRPPLHPSAPGGSAPIYSTEETE